MKYYLITLIITLVLCGCNNSEELVFHESKSVSAVRCRSERFQALLLGSPTKPYDGSPTITIRAPQVNEVRITGILEGRLAKLCEQVERYDASRKVGIGPHPGRGPRTGMDVWGAGSLYMTILGADSVWFSLVVRDDKVLGVGIYGDTAAGVPPIEVKSEDSDWHAFPLSREALTDLFDEPRAAYQWMAE